MDSLCSVLTWIPPELVDPRQKGLEGSQVHQAVFYTGDVARGAFLGNYQFLDTRQEQRRPYKYTSQHLPRGEKVEKFSMSSSIPGAIPRQWAVGTNHRFAGRPLAQDNFSRCVEFGRGHGKPQDVRVWSCYVAVLFAGRMNLWVDEGKAFKKLCTLSLPESSAKARELFFNAQCLRIWTDDGQMHEFNAIPHNFKPKSQPSPVRSERLLCFSAALKQPSLQALALPHGLVWVENTPSELLGDVEIPQACYYQVIEAKQSFLQLSKPERFPSLCVGRFTTVLSKQGQVVFYVARADSTELRGAVASDLFDPEQMSMTALEAGSQFSIYGKDQKTFPEDWVFEKSCTQLPGFSPHEQIASYETGVVVQGQKKDADHDWQQLVWVPKESSQAASLLFEAVWHQNSSCYSTGSFNYSKHYSREGHFVCAGNWLAWFDPLRATRFIHYDGQTAAASFVHYHPRGSDKAREVWLFPNPTENTLDYMLLWKSGRLEHWRRSF